MSAKQCKQCKHTPAPSLRTLQKRFLETGMLELGSALTKLRPAWHLHLSLSTQDQYRLLLAAIYKKSKIYGLKECKGQVIRPFYKFLTSYKDYNPALKN
jgi:hypothetical protein